MMIIETYIHVIGIVSTIVLLVGYITYKFLNSKK
jgi:hypothetical protein